MHANDTDYREPIHALTWHYVFPINGHPIVAVRPAKKKSNVKEKCNSTLFLPLLPRVLVPESDHVSQLVHDDAELVAVFPDRDGLRAVAALPHEGATTEIGQKLLVGS